MMNRQNSLYVLASTVLLLNACGGGSSDSSPPPVVRYTVTATAGAGGTISPSSVQVASGQATSFTVTANAGFEIDTVSGCAGSLSGSTYNTGLITAPCTVSASFNELDPVVESISGRVIDGYLSGATVFLDINGNGQLDDAEPNTRSAADGAYELGLRSAAAACRPYSALVAQVPKGAIDADRGAVSDTFQMVIAPTLVQANATQHITPLTTLQWNFLRGNMVYHDRQMPRSSCELLRDDAALQTQYSNTLAIVEQQLAQVFAGRTAEQLAIDYIAAGDAALGMFAEDYTRGLQAGWQQGMEFNQLLGGPDDIYTGLFIVPSDGLAATQWLRVRFWSYENIPHANAPWRIVESDAAEVFEVASDFGADLTNAIGWGRQRMIRSFDDYDMTIMRELGECGDDEWADMQLGASFAAEQLQLRDLSAITSTDVERYGCDLARPISKQVMARVRATAEQAATTIRFDIRYQNGAFVFLNNWSRFLAARNTYNFAELVTLLEPYLATYDAVEQLPFAAVTDKVVVTQERIEDGVAVLYTKVGMLQAGEMVWQESRTAVSP